MTAGIVPTYIYRAVFWRQKQEEFITNEEYALKDNNMR